MSKQMGLVAAVVIGALLAACSSTPPAQPQTAMSAATTARALAFNPEFVQKSFANYRQLIFADRKDCGDADCNVTITLYTTTYDGKLYCIARLPEELTFAPAGAFKPERRISWTLDTTNLPADRTANFHEKHGILLVYEKPNGLGQIDPDNSATSATTFGAKNKFKKKGTTTYVPVIIFGIKGQDEVAELCAVGDPKIVNN